MIQVRYIMFETNSSSANVFIIPKDQRVVIKKRFIFRSDHSSDIVSEQALCYIFDDWFDEGINKEAIDQIINFLYSVGVEEIIYDGPNEYIEKAINKYKDHIQNLGLPDGWTEEQLVKTLFGCDTIAEVFSEYDSNRPDYNAETNEYVQEDENNWYKSYGC